MVNEKKISPRLFVTFPVGFNLTFGVTKDDALRAWTPRERPSDPAAPLRIFDLLSLKLWAN